MYGDGNTSRDYTYVGDIVKGLISAISYDKTPFEIINLGNNYSISLAELINMIEKVMGKKATIQQLPEQAGDVPKTFADINKAKKLLGYDPETKLEVGIRNFYEWFLKNEDMLIQIEELNT